MAIPSVALTPPSLFPIPSIDPVQGALLLRQSERSLFIGSVNASTFPSTDTVEFSDTSQLLSSVAQIADAAEAAEQGTTISTQAIIENAQDFVDSVNAVNLGDDFVLNTVINTSIVPEPATPQAEALGAVGISVLPIDSEGDSFILSLDTGALETALLADPAETAEQLAAAVAPIATAAAAQATTTTIVASSVTQNTFALGAAGEPETGLLSPQLAPQVLAAVGTALEGLPPVLVPVPVVPDLTVENADLRRALADTALSDIVSAIAGNLDSAADSPLPDLSLANEAITEAALVAPSLLGAVETAPEADETADVSAPPQAQALTAASATAVSPPPSPPDASATNQAALLNVAANVQAQAALTPSELLTTPLEQITRLAGNPTVAGAVAAFLVPTDDGVRAAKGGIQADLDVINPVAAVLRTEAIAASLANGSNDRQEGSAESRLNQWRMSPTRFI
jgi:hypothetical protein